MIDFLQANPLVPVFYHDDAAYCCSMAQACYDGGIRIFEFTNRGEKALPNFQSLVQYCKENCPEMKMGIGTIFTPEDAEKFIGAGAQFVVQPCLDKAVGEVCQKHIIDWFPGVITPTEIHEALKAGAKAVKIFPGNLVGPSYVKSLLGPFKSLKVMVTGGVEPTHESINSWLGAGATAVGLGSQLFKNDDPKAIQELVKGLLKK